MAAPNREIVNINLFTTTSAISDPAESKGVSKDIQMDAPGSRSTIASMNSSRELLVLYKASSIKYSAHMEAQNTKPN